MNVEIPLMQIVTNWRGKCVFRGSVVATLVLAYTRIFIILQQWAVIAPKCEAAFQVVSGNFRHLRPHRVCENWGRLNYFLTRSFVACNRRECGDREKRDIDLYNYLLKNLSAKGEVTKICHKTVFLHIYPHKWRNAHAHTHRTVSSAKEHTQPKHTQCWQSLRVRLSFK